MSNEYRMRQRTDLVVVHCSATPPSMNIGRDEIDEWHRDRGWNGIGYHYVIRRDGSIESGRPLWAVGAHTRGHNYVSVGVCWVGGVDDSGDAQDNRTEAQKDALRTLLTGLLLSFPGAKLLGHRDLSPDLDGDGVVEEWEFVKECPSFDVQSWWLEVGPQPTQEGE